MEFDAIDAKRNIQNHALFDITQLLYVVNSTPNELRQSGCICRRIR